MKKCAGTIRVDGGEYLFAKDVLFTADAKKNTLSIGLDYLDITVDLSRVSEEITDAYLKQIEVEE